MSDIDWWRFVTPISTKWSLMLESKITYKSFYIFGIRVAKLQTNDPSKGRTM